MLGSSQPPPRIVDLPQVWTSSAIQRQLGKTLHTLDNTDLSQNKPSRGFWAQEKHAEGHNKCPQYCTRVAQLSGRVLHQVLCRNQNELVGVWGCREIYRMCSGDIVSIFPFVQRSNMILPFKFLYTWESTLLKYFSHNFNNLLCKLWGIAGGSDTCLHIIAIFLPYFRKATRKRGIFVFSAG